MMTEITVTEHSFGNGNDMLATQPQTTRQTYDVDIDLYSGPTGEAGAVDAYIVNGFLKIVFPDGQSIYHNVNEIKSFVVTPL